MPLSLADALRRIQNDLATLLEPEPLRQLCRDGDDVVEGAAAQHGHRQPRADRGAEHEPLQGLHALDRHATRVEDDIAQVDTGQPGRAARHHLDDP